MTLAAELAEAADACAPRNERRQRARLARLIEDPSAAAFVLTLADDLLRIPTDDRAAARLRSLVRERGVPRSLGRLDHAGLLVGAAVAPWLPGVVMPLVRRRLRWETREIIRSADRRRLGRYLARRRAERFPLNLNVLGEATLGDDEAARRLEATLATLTRPDVDYVSVKISAICRSRQRVGVRCHRRPGGRAIAAFVRGSAPERAAQVRQSRHGGISRPPADGRCLPAPSR